jgi:hypothetical protein
VEFGMKSGQMHPCTSDNRIDISAITNTATMLEIEYTSILLYTSTEVVLLTNFLQDKIK